MSHDTKHDDRVRNIAYQNLRYTQHRSYYEQQLLIASARMQTAFAINEAEKNGREFSPLFWYVGDDGQLIMTLWDMT